MASNTETRNVPLGLQKLMALDRVVIIQSYSWTSKNYDVCTQGGERLFEVLVDRGSLASMCCGSGRILMDLYDSNHKLAISLLRPYDCSGVVSLEVIINGELVSLVHREISFTTVVLHINDGRDQPVLRIKGPRGIALDYFCELQTLDKKPIGSISRPWRGMTREFIPRTVEFHVTFPRDLDVRYKAAAIGSCILIIIPTISGNNP